MHKELEAVKAKLATASQPSSTQRELWRQAESVADESQAQPHIIHITEFSDRDTKVVRRSN